MFHCFVLISYIFFFVFFLYLLFLFFLFFFFFFNDTATTEIYTLSLHDALPISENRSSRRTGPTIQAGLRLLKCVRSEEHTSELQSRRDLVCRLLLEKKKKKIIKNNTIENKLQYQLTQSKISHGI